MRAQDDKVLEDRVRKRAKEMLNVGFKEIIDFFREMEALQGEGALNFERGLL